jgi:microcin C transport system permease protein
MEMALITKDFNNNNFFHNFKENKRGYYSLIIFIFLFIISLFADIIANDKPLIVYYKQQFYFPIIQDISETEFGGELLSATDYLDPYVSDAINKDGWMIFPIIKYNYDTINLSLQDRAPSKPTFSNILGTDDQGRDVLARIIYGLRISLFFGIILSFFSLIIGIFLGAIQGYFGGKIDLLLQRFIEIWSSLPVMFILIIFSSIIAPSFFSVLIIMLLFSWLGVANYIRAEFLRLRNFDYVRSAVALGASNFRIIFHHILPNASPIIIANLPFLIASSITTLTALDFLGLGLAVGSPSLGELLAQGKNNINAYWLVISGFTILTILLSILIFIAEALREATAFHKNNI